MKVYLDEGAFLPLKAHYSDAGFDLFCKEDTVVVEPQSSALFNTGVHMQIPAGYAGMLISKSGLNVKHNILSTGLIDSGYTGSIIVKLYNHGTDPYIFKRGDKISQIVIMPIINDDLEVSISPLEETERGGNGFGSTGK